MPIRLPSVGGASPIRPTSVGRQSIDSSALRVTGGEGLQALGAGLEAQGEKQQRRDDAQAAEAKRLKQQQDKLEFNKASLHYLNGMNNWMMINGDRLDIEQQAKDFIFRAVVHALRQTAPADDNDFQLGQACDLSGEGTCEACQ